MADILGSLESIGKVITEKAEVVTKKTEEVVEIQKIKSQIRGLGRNNERDYQDIGKMVFDSYKKGDTLEDSLAELCEAISERNETITECEKKVAELKGLDVCSNCKEHLEPNAVYCSKCGTKVEQDIFEEEN